MTVTTEKLGQVRAWFDTTGPSVIWDNRGLLHRVTHYEATSPRELHRITVA